MINLFDVTKMKKKRVINDGSLRELLQIIIPVTGA